MTFKKITSVFAICALTLFGCQSAEERARFERALQQERNDSLQRVQDELLRLYEERNSFNRVFVQTPKELHILAVNYIKAIKGIPVTSGSADIELTLEVDRDRCGSGRSPGQLLYVSANLKDLKGLGGSTTIMFSSEAYTCTRGNYIDEIRRVADVALHRF